MSNGISILPHLVQYREVVVPCSTTFKNKLICVFIQRIVSVRLSYNTTMFKGNVIIFYLILI